MKFKTTVETAVIGLKSHKSRSALTILGIVIGIAAIMIIVSLGKGAQSLILSQLQGLGSKTIAVIPGREPRGPTDVLSTFTDSIKERDLELLLQGANAPHISRIMPIVFGTEAAAFESETYRPTVIGATELFSEIYDTYPADGRMFTDDDVRASADVVVIGTKVKEELFGEENPIGERIRMKGRSLRVIGVLPSKGQLAFFNLDELAIMPYTTAQRYIFGIKYFNRLVIEADSEEYIAATVEDIERTLRNAHNITDPSKDDFFVETAEGIMATVSTITDVLTLFLVAVAAISLLVGGVGIMNIMLVSVTERTREIGLRKSVGATNKNILLQFLSEAVLLTSIGGLIGIILGALVSFGLTLALGRFAGFSWAFQFPLSAALIGFLVSAAIGLIFGLYPARQASKKDPIEALRYE